MNVIKLFLLGWLIGGSVNGQTNGLEADPARMESYVRAGGKRVETSEGLVVWWAQLSKRDVERINEARQLTSRQPHTHEEVMGDSWLNRVYLSDHLTILRNQFLKLSGRTPRPDELFVVWQTDLATYRRLEWKVENVKDEKLNLRLELFRSFENQREAVRATPLPTDGRPPSRYWPRDEAAKAAKGHPVPPTR